MKDRGGFAAKTAAEEGAHVTGAERTGVEDGAAVTGVSSVSRALMAALALSHSAATSAMMSPPVVMESKVNSEEMSASRELRLVSPGSSGVPALGETGAPETAPELRPCDSG